jgi:hypothetical protein
MKTSINLLKVLATLIPSLILVFFLVKYFPNTGLGRIIALPFIFVVNTALITIGIKFVHRLNYLRAAGIWMLVIILTLALTVLIYPQEYGPSVIIQLWNKM